jgi:hypothetical protein
MTHPRWWTLRNWWAIAVVVLAAKMVAVTLWRYREYFPPDFNSEFLQGREATFFGSYQWAFYPHIIGGPLSLVLGCLLMSHTVRRRWPRWHRQLGRVQVANVLVVVAPSGGWMALYAATGLNGSIALGLLAVVTWLCAWWGWIAAGQRRFADHQCWMLRTFTLLCSAIVIRLLGGIGTLLPAAPWWYDHATVWLCWVVPLLLCECCLRHSNR